MKINRIYLDMDGVIADFDSYFQDCYGYYPPDFEEKYGREEFWDKLWQDAKFFEKIPNMPNKRELIYLCIDTCDYLTILSAPSRTNHALCVLQKRNWLDKEPLTFNIPAIFESKKEKYAGPNRLLIDDRKTNIDRWIAKGGIGYLYDGDFKKFEQFMSKVNKDD